MADPTTKPYHPPMSVSEPVLLKDPLGLLACWLYGVSTALCVLIHFGTMAVPEDALNDDETPEFSSSSRFKRPLTAIGSRHRGFLIM